jgi:hypothetical protein
MSTPIEPAGVKCTCLLTSWLPLCVLEFFMVRLGVQTAEKEFCKMVRFAVPVNCSTSMTHHAAQQMERTSSCSYGVQWTRPGPAQLVQSQVRSPGKLHPTLKQGCDVIHDHELLQFLDCKLPLWLLHGPCGHRSLFPYLRMCTCCAISWPSVDASNQDNSFDPKVHHNTESVPVYDTAPNTRQNSLVRCLKPLHVVLLLSCAGYAL